MSLHMYVLSIKTVIKHITIVVAEVYINRINVAMSLVQTSDIEINVLVAATD